MRLLDELFGIAVSPPSNSYATMAALTGIGALSVTRATRRAHRPRLSESAVVEWAVLRCLSFASFAHFAHLPFKGGRLAKADTRRGQSVGFSTEGIAGDPSCSRFQAGAPEYRPQSRL